MVAAKDACGAASTWWLQRMQLMAANTFCGCKGCTRGQQAALAAEGNRCLCIHIHRKTVTCVLYDAIFIVAPELPCVFSPVNLSNPLLHPTTSQAAQSPGYQHRPFSHESRTLLEGCAAWHGVCMPLHKPSGRHGWGAIFGWSAPRGTIIQASLL
jgi:hypothetical protein